MNELVHRLKVSIPADGQTFSEVDFWVAASSARFPTEEINPKFTQDISEVAVYPDGSPYLLADHDALVRMFPFAIVEIEHGTKDIRIVVTFGQTPENSLGQGKTP